MKEQNYRNHKRYLIGYHGIAFTLIFILFTASIYNLYVSFKNQNEIRTGIMFLITSLSLLFLFFYSRIFALKAQDRSIRAEEQFRFYLISGKISDERITMSQLLALRFAPDEELLALSVKAAEDGLTPDQIKQEIKKWRVDRHRV